MEKQEELNGLMKDLQVLEETMNLNLEVDDIDKIMSSMDIQGLLKYMDQTNGALDIFESRADALIEKVDKLFQQMVQENDSLVQDKHGGQQPLSENQNLKKVDESSQTDLKNSAHQIQRREEQVNEPTETLLKTSPMISGEECLNENVGASKQNP